MLGFSHLWKTQAKLFHWLVNDLQHIGEVYFEFQFQTQSHKLHPKTILFDRFCFWKQRFLLSFG